MSDTNHLNSVKYSFKSIFTNTMWYGIVPKLPSLINVILLPLITPYLTAWDYGIWGKISAYTSFATAFCTMGLNVHLTNSYYEYGKKFYLVWSRLNFILHVLSLICSSILFIILWFSLKDLDVEYRIIISALSVVPALLYPNQLLAQHLFPVRATPKPLVLRNFVASALGIASLYVSVVQFRLGYVGFVLSAAVTAIVAYCFFYSPLKKERISLVLSNRFNRIRKWFIIGLPLVPHTLGFSLLSSSTRIVMDVCNISTDEIGIFTNGATIGGYVVIIISAIASALGPLMQQYYRKGELTNFRNLYYLDFTITFACVFVLSIWMKEIYMLLIKNDELYVAYAVAQIICYSNLMYPFYHFTSIIIGIQKKTVHILWLTFIPGIICIILNLVLLPLYGYKIAAWVSVISYWTQFFLPLFVPYLNKITKEWIGSVWIMPLFALCAGLCVILIDSISDLSLFVKIVISSCLVLSTIVLLRFFNIRIVKNDNSL